MSIYGRQMLKTSGRARVLKTSKIKSQNCYVFQVLVHAIFGSKMMESVQFNFHYVLHVCCGKHSVNPIWYPQPQCMYALIQSPVQQFLVSKLQNS